MAVSCTKVVEFPIPTVAPKNVVNVILTADSSLGGYLYETLSVLSNDTNKPIQNGAMVITDDLGNQVAYQLNGNKGRYFSNNVGTANQCYKVSFQSDLGTSFGETCIPSIPKYDLLDTSILVQLGDTVLSLKIGLNDSSSITNYYRFTCKAFQIKSVKVGIGGKLDTIYEWNNIAFTSNSFSYFVNEYNYSTTTYLLKDDKFNGQTAYLNFSLPISNSRKIEFFIEAIDFNLFEYYRTSSAQKFIQTDPNAHYVNVYDNVSNGYGIIGSKNSTKITYIKR